MYSKPIVNKNINPFLTFQTNWENFVSSDLLFEGDGRREVSLSFLLEEYARKRLSEKAFSKLLEESLILEFSALQEGALDVIQKYYKTVHSGIEKVSSVVKEKYLEAMTQVYFWLKNTFEKLARLVMQKAIGPVSKALSGFFNFIKRFRQAHPLLYKIASVLCFSLACAVFLVASAEVAEAAIRVGAKGSSVGTPMAVETGNENVLSAMKGLMRLQMDTDPELKPHLQSAISLINQHDSASEPMLEVSALPGKLKALIQSAYVTVDSALDAAKETHDASLAATLQDLVDSGKEQTLEIVHKVEVVVRRWKTEFGSGEHAQSITTTSKTGALGDTAGKYEFSRVAGDVAKQASSLARSRMGN